MDTKPKRSLLSCSAAVLLAAAILVPARQAAAAPAVQRDAAERIAEILEAQRSEQHIPGFAFALVRQDRLELVIVRGVRDVERALPVTPDTVFPIGSCTKAFTSMAIGIARDQHLLSLDDHPRRFLPWFHMADPRADAEVSLRDMLSHRTGLKAKADLAAEPGVLSREEFVRAATAAKPAAPFRTAFQYSNAMYSAAGEVLGSAYHSNWENVIQQQIFAPLGMTASLISARDVATVADHATGYVYVPQTGGWRAASLPTGLQALAPAGSIASTARDMAQWLRLLTGGGRIGDRQIVSAATLQELFAPQIPIDAKMSYALGWVTYTWDGEQVVEHNGGSEGISALVSFIPSQRVGFVFLANTSPNFLTLIGNAGSLLWPLILGREPPAAAPADEGPADQRLPSVEALLSRMIEAVGGEDVLRRHKTLEIHAHKTYENQGIRAALTVRAKAPASRVEEEVWTAAGREMGRLRIYFDGRHGGQETTFGQDAVNDDAANDRARRDADLHPLLSLTDLYQEVRVDSKAKVGAEEAFVLTLVPKAGPKVRLYVSTATGLILERETEGETVMFSDYRSVDGERIPFLSTISDALGETTVEVEQARYGVSIEDTAFAPATAPEPSWQRHASPVTDDLHNAFFVDDTRGWIVAHQSGAVLQTVDGGASWRVQARLGEGFLESIHFVDARNGWICGDKGRLYRTRNGGESWELRSFGEGTALYGVRFLDPKRGFLVGLDPATERAVMLETADGGETWKQREDLPPARGFADALAFPSSSLGFVGGMGVILASRDSGRTWKVSHEPASGFVRDLFFLDERTGWAVGHNGLVLRTRDVGESWETLPPWTRNRLRSVFFRDARQGWIVGDASPADPGVLFETMDGGVTWNRVEIKAPDLHRFAKSPGRLWVVGKDGAIFSRAP